MRRLLYVCLDGLADDPIPEFGDRTPLEAADTPFMDSLAQRGRTGTVTTVGEGIAPASPDFWQENESAIYATLIEVEHVRQVEPIAWDKSDRRGWVVLHRRRSMNLTLFE